MLQIKLTRCELWATVFAGMFGCFRDIDPLHFGFFPLDFGGLAMPKVKVRRSDLKPGEVLCSYCTARCCRYFALPIETPTDWTDFDHMRWYIMHGRSAIFVDEGSWYLLVWGDCENLLEDNRCGIYLTRPEICRSYSTDICEYDNDSCYEKYFETQDQIWEYAEAVLPPKPQPRKKAGAANLPALPVLN